MYACKNKKKTQVKTNCRTMSDKVNPKLINFVGSSVLLLYVGLLRDNDGIDLLVLEQYQINQIIYGSIYVSMIFVLLLKQVFTINHRVALPLNFYYCTIVASILIFSVRRLVSDGISKWIWIGVYSLAIVCLWYSVFILYNSKLFNGQNDKDYIISDKKQKKQKRVKKMFQSKHNKTFSSLKKLTKIQQQNEKINKVNNGQTKNKNCNQWAELHRVMLRNCVVWNVIWHTINISMLLNKYIFNKHANSDNMMDIMWIYWTLEYINYQTKIIHMDNNIIAPYILIISLLISYDMFLLLRILPIFCVIICLSMIAYKLSTNQYKTEDDNDNDNDIDNEYNKENARVVYTTENGNLQPIKDLQLMRVVESLPLDYLFSSLFASLGVMMAPSIISVFWRVWHLIPLIINGHDGEDGEDPVCSCQRDIYQKAEIVFIQFVQSMFVMYVVLKEYKLYILWKYYKIFDIYSTLFVLTMHTIVSKLSFIIFTVCFSQYFIYGNESCMNYEHDINPEMGTIKPPTVVLFIFYISFVINSWVVYYKFLWKNDKILYKSIKLYTSNFNLKKSFNQNQFNVILFYKYDSIKIHIATTWVHFCGRVFSVFRNDTTIERIHVVSSMILVIFGAYHQYNWQKRFNDTGTGNRNVGFIDKIGILFIFLCLATLMFKLYVVKTISQIMLEYFGIITNSWDLIRNIHIT
eukprot:83846_1